MKNFVSGGSRSRMAGVDGRISEVNIKRQTGESAAGERGDKDGLERSEPEFEIKGGQQKSCG